jgi:hypothetical protein
MEAFGEWFDENVKSLEMCEEEGVDIEYEMKKWCRNNNHDYNDYDDTRRLGVYNNIIDEKEKNEFNEDKLRYDKALKHLNRNKETIDKDMRDILKNDGVNFGYIVPMMPKSKKMQILKNYYNEILNSSKEWRNGRSIKSMLKHIKDIEDIEDWADDNEDLNEWIYEREFLYKLFEV